MVVIINLLIFHKWDLCKNQLIESFLDSIVAYM